MAISVSRRKDLSQVKFKVASFETAASTTSGAETSVSQQRYGASLDTLDLFRTFRRRSLTSALLWIGDQ